MRIAVAALLVLSSTVHAQTFADPVVQAVRRNGGASVQCIVTSIPTSLCPSGTSNGVTSAGSANMSGAIQTASASAQGEETIGMGDEIAWGATHNVDYLNIFGPATPSQILFHYAITYSTSASGGNQETFAYGLAYTAIYFGYPNTLVNQALLDYVQTSAPPGSLAYTTRNECRYVANIGPCSPTNAPNTGNYTSIAAFSYIGPSTFFALDAFADARFSDRSGPDSSTTLVSGAATASVELTLLGIDAVDASGQSLSSVDSCTFASGAACVLGQPTTTAPEPESLVLFGTGLVGLAAVSQRRRTE